MIDFKRLFDYDTWANRETLASLTAAGAGAPEKARRRLAHVVGAQRLWLARIEGAPGKPPAVWPELSPAAIEAALEDLARRWGHLVSGFDDAAFARTISYVNSKGEAWTSTVEDILMHVVLHGGYHRGQIASDLREAGFPPAYTDYIEAARRGFL